MTTAPCSTVQHPRAFVAFAELFEESLNPNPYSLGFSRTSHAHMVCRDKFCAILWLAGQVWWRI